MIDKVALIHLENKKVLSTRSRGKDAWYLPGGKREGGETDEACLSREIKEELSVDLELKSLEYLGTFRAQAHGKAEGVVVQMTCYTGDYTGELEANQEVEEFAWHDSTTDVSLLSPVDQIIFKYLKEHDLIS